jgi:hypothetical protein
MSKRGEPSGKNFERVETSDIRTFVPLLACKPLAAEGKIGPALCSSGLLHWRSAAEAVPEGTMGLTPGP